MIDEDEDVVEEDDDAEDSFFSAAAFELLARDLPPPVDRPPFPVRPAVVSLEAVFSPLATDLAFLGSGGDRLEAAAAGAIRWFLKAGYCWIRS